MLRHLMAEPWPPEEATRLRRLARSYMRQHACGGSREKLARDNCASCVLAGSLNRAGVAVRRPDVASWARVFVQAGVPIEEKLMRQELCRTDNPWYVDGLRRDLATWPQAQGSGDR